MEKEKYSRGKNPRSRNSPKIGEKRFVTLPDYQWLAAKELSGNYSQGIRDMVDMALSEINHNIHRFCVLWDIEEKTQEGIENWLLNEFPGLSSTRKTHKHLAKEIVLGETALSPNKERLISIVELDVRCASKPNMRVYERHQIIADGSLVERRHTDGKLYLPTEKLYIPESPLSVAKRAIREELEIKGKSFVVGESKKSQPPQSAYGDAIKSIAIVHRVLVEIEPHEFKDEYHEIQPEKTTVFYWDKI